MAVSMSSSYFLVSDERYTVLIGAENLAEAEAKALVSGMFGPLDKQSVVSTVVVEHSHSFLNSWVLLGGALMDATTPNKGWLNSQGEYVSLNVEVMIGQAFLSS